MLQTNELRKINTVLTTDIQQSETHQREAQENFAAALLNDGEGVLPGGGGGVPVTHTVGRGGGRDRVPFQATGSRTAGVMRFGRQKKGGAALNTSVGERAKEMHQWVVHQQADGEEEYPDEDGSQVEKGGVTETLDGPSFYVETRGIDTQTMKTV